MSIMKDINSISRITDVNIDLNEIAGHEVADHLPQFSDVLEKILKQVLEQIADPGETVEVDIMTSEEMASEADLAQQLDEDPLVTQGQLFISITETFPCK